MKYNLHQKLIISDNAIPDRCFYIPYGKKPDNLYDFSLSDRLTLLTDWKFSYFKKFSDDIISAEASTPAKVPSVWQTYGVEPHCYLNARYPFPVDPPYILKDIPCAKYSTDYKIEKKIGKYYIDFEGVDSAYYLFVNGDYAGYSTVSHCRTEFDITDKLNVGLNEITVIVLKWCSGSYLECQDKLRMSGIFREVYILNRPEDHLFDYKITTNGNDTIVFSGDKECAVRLFDRDRFIEEKTGKEVSFFIKNAKLWTAETPDLYTLEIERNGEHIYEKVGIRNISIKNAVYRINDKPVKFKGVNRHSMTVNGYVESVDDMIKDILLMKKYNINDGRTVFIPLIHLDGPSDNNVLKIFVTGNLRP